MATTHDATNQIAAIGQAWAEAEQRGDADALAHILMEDFGFVGPLGFMLTKAQWLERHTSGDLRYTEFTWEPAQTRFYGDTAIETGRVAQAGTYKGRDIAGQFRLRQARGRPSPTRRTKAVISRGSSAPRRYSCGRGNAGSLPPSISAPSPMPRRAPR